MTRKNCPKSNKLPNLVTLLTSSNYLITKYVDRHGVREREREILNVKVKPLIRTSTKFSFIHGLNFWHVSSRWPSVCSCSQTTHNQRGTFILVMGVNGPSSFKKLLTLKCSIHLIDKDQSYTNSGNVVVAQWAQVLLLTPDDPGLNPTISIFIKNIFNCWKDENKRKANYYTN